MKNKAEKAKVKIEPTIKIILFMITTLYFFMHPLGQLNLNLYAKKALFSFKKNFSNSADVLL